jgi:Na+-transporting NADH:ubiquinone oxidoreductase subunit NqrF
MVAKLVIKLITKQFKLDKIYKYVFDKNELDNKVSNHEERLKKVESLAHEPKEFPTCCECKKDIKENFDSGDKKWYDK